LIEAGRSDEARELAVGAEFQAVRWDESWFIAMLLWAEACSRLGVRDRGGEAYELLAPFSGQFVAGGSMVSGSIDWALGELAATLERHGDADRHFAAAAEFLQRLGAPLFLARTRAGWARALIDRGRAEDIGRAWAMLEQADDSAARLGAAAITRQVAECRAALAAARR
jgi:hypothetical protein